MRGLKMYFVEVGGDIDNLVILAKNIKEATKIALEVIREEYTNGAEVGDVEITPVEDIEPDDLPLVQYALASGRVFVSS